MYRRLGGLQGQSGQVQIISLPPGFDPRTVQHVASHYTYYATQPTQDWCAADYVKLNTDKTKYIFIPFMYHLVRHRSQQTLY